jgi:hypothetical protein
MLEAKPEKVEATDTIVTTSAFCLEVKMLYGTSGSDEVTTCFSRFSAMIQYDVER